MTTVAELSRLTENKLHDSGKNVSQAFWCEEKDIDKMELLQGDHVRLKTKGEGPFIGEICHNVILLFIIIVSITKFSTVIGSPCAYLSHNQRAITWVSDLTFFKSDTCNWIPM